ncbi:hypothetical protein [Hydrogenophaga intermedia]|uniref:hypothetical protein n=1 Tax=Hydrogenophaga intermedia TaxID=65786 RepID=UPI002044CA63|nr:hypothetical protein [Hydrogenophaga intermedia]MCM3564512.1 hypothetical protein [Hydrogenophaga intermedia]
MPASTHPRLTLMLWASALCACGGGSSQPAPPAPVLTLPNEAVLTVSTAALALASSGQSRDFVITNVGEHVAHDLTVSGVAALPPGSALNSDCSTLAPAASCTLTVTPGAMPTSAPGDRAPQPVALTLTGSNTPALLLHVWVLGPGSVYQGGFVFDLDDTPPLTSSVGGKVLALEDATPDTVRWGTANTPTSNTDGALNTTHMVNATGLPGDPDRPYSAWACDAHDGDGHDAWYLPAICEWGYDRDGRGSGCGTAAAPTMNNIASQILDKGVDAGPFRHVEYWSSTGSQTDVWVQVFGPGIPAAQVTTFPSGIQGVRCARAITR